MKREPILADRALATKDDGLLNARYREACLDSLRVSKKFVLDSQGAIYIARMLREMPRVVADAVDFAIPAFERMWVELPFRAFYREITGRESDENADVRIGYLFRGSRVNTIVEARENGKPVVDLLPIEYQLHRSMTEGEQLELCQRLGTSRLGLSLWFWGESAETFAQGEKQFSEHDPRLEDWDREGLRALRDAHCARIAPLRNGYDGDIGQIMNGSGGDLRNIVALLLFLNRTRDIQYQQSVPQEPSVLLNRVPRTLLPHSVITLNLNPLPRLYRLSAGQGGEEAVARCPRPFPPR